MAKDGKIVSGLFWKFTERIASQVVTFFVSIILARLLAPSDYGVIAMVTVFITIANVLVTSGLGNALIQKKDADTLDFSSVFYAQLGLAALLYIVLFVSAPLIASFYKEGYENLAPVLRVLGLNLPINAIHNVQQSYVSRKMIFKKFFVATLSGTVVSAIVGIYMACTGCGVWALVGQYLSNTIINTCVLWFVVDWRPQLKLSLDRLRPLLRFGWKVLTVDIVNTLLNNVRTLIVGKVYTSEDLAYYNKGEQFPSLIVTNINASIQSVLFPAMSDVQEKKESVKTLLRNMISMGSFVIFPLVFGFMAVSEPVVLLLLTEKWADCIPYVQIFCASYSLRIISTSCAQSIKAIGRSDVYLKSSTIYKIIELFSIISTSMISVKAIAVGTLMNAIILVVINYCCNCKLLRYTIREFVADLLPNLLLSFVMVIPVFLLGRLSSSGLMVILQVLMGAVVYIGGAFVFRMKPAMEIVELITKMIQSRREEKR